MDIKWVGSPNYDTNRKPITTVVIHWFGMGTLAGADATFQKPGGTSAHYAISDKIIHQYVKEEHVAYHAGVYTMNQRSIGIEHDANPDKPLSEQSYQTSGQLVREICQKYNIPIDRQHIIKHSEVPRSTQCCGTVNIDKIVQIAKGIIVMPNELYTYLGVTSDQEAKTRLSQHLGEKDGKCVWGSADGDGGGFLGSARREISSKQLTIDNQNTEIARLNKIISEMPPVTEPGYTPTGKLIHINTPTGFEEISYKKD